MYGEITPIGFRKLAERLQLANSDRFVDLGSGLGRVVIQAAREFGVQSSCGVELAGSRHEIAMAALGRESCDTLHNVTFLCADCTDPVLWFGNSVGDGCLCGITVIYVCSIMFGPELMESLARLIEATPSVRAVASVRHWPGGLMGFVGDELPEHYETSWTAPSTLDQPSNEEGTPIHIYVRR